MSTPASRLFIVRHAHAAKAAPGEDDFDRPLDERGRREAASIGAALPASTPAPERILCSPAKRTRETLLHAGAPLARAQVDHPAQLYPGNATDYLAAIRQPEDVATLMLIGHNPGVADLAEMLVGDGEADAMARIAQGFPTAGVASIEFDAPLSRIAAGTGYLRRFLTPRC